MKKILFSLIVLSFLIWGYGVLAQNNDLPSPGITPDSPFYFLKSWKESIQTFFTFGEENKAKQFLHLADVRLAEYQKMIEKGKTEIAQKTLEKYEKQLNHALEKAEEVREKGKDIEKLKETISEKIIKHQEVFNNVLEKAPEEAKKGIENAIEMSQKGFENAIQAVSGEKKEELQRRAEEVKIEIEEKIIESKPAELGATPPKPSISSEPTPTEIRYYTCPDGTKVVSGKCYGEGATLRCSMNMQPDLQCPSPTPPVTKGGACPTAGEIKYYQCPSTSPVSHVGWCACGPSSGPAKNVWRCGHLPELSCPKPDPIASRDYISCQKGAVGNHKCSDGTAVRWQCQCLNIVPEATAYWDWNCVLEPVKFCPALNTSDQPAISEIEIRNYSGSIRIFSYTTTPTISHVEYGPTTSYGSKVASGNFLSIGSGPDTTYHFRIIAEDAQGNKIISDDYTFTTGL